MNGDKTMRYTSWMWIKERKRREKLIFVKTVYIEKEMTTRFPMIRDIDNYLQFNTLH